MPKDANIEKVSTAFEGFEMNKRLVFHAYTDGGTLVDSMITATHDFASDLENEVGDIISDIQLEVTDIQLLDLYNYYYHHLLFYLDSSDYDVIDERIFEEGIVTSVRQPHKTLLSLVGAVTSKMQIKDPVGMTSFPLERTKDNL